MKRELKNARIILTGASSGIGRQLALQAAKAGAKLVLTARRAQLLEEVKAQIESETGGNCAVELVVGDITVQETREAVVNRCVEAFGGVDVLVNNAGAAASGEFETGTPDRLERVMALNLTAPVEMIRLVLPIMKKWKENPAAEQKPIPPMIVNLSSVVGLRGVTHYSEYCAGKAAIRAFSQSIRTEFHRYGIDVLVVCPGSTDTGFFTDYIENSGEPTWPHHNRVTPAYVAKQMLKAIRKGKMEIIPFFLGKVMKWMDYFFPKSLERAMVFFAEHPGIFK